MRSRLAVLTLAALAALTVALTASGGAAAASKPRIVALTPFTANALASLGVIPIARGDMPGSNDRYVAKVQNIKKLPLSHPNGPNIEKLAVLNPSLVLTSPQWNKGTTTMRQLGMKVVVSDPQKVDDVPAQTKAIGKLVGKTKLGIDRAALQAHNIGVAKRAARRHPTVLLILGVGRTPYAFLKNSWGGDVITQAGGKLITGGLSNSGGFARISNEFVVQQDPDVIIAVPHGTTNAADRAELAKYLGDNPAWKDTKAVQNKHLFVSKDNALLQASPLAAQVIADVQKQYLENR